MHLPFDNTRYSPHAVSNVECGLYEINKNNRANAIHMDQVCSKNVPRPNWSSFGLERSRTRTWTITTDIWAVVLIYYFTKFDIWGGKWTVCRVNIPGFEIESVAGRLCACSWGWWLLWWASGAGIPEHAKTASESDTGAGLQDRGASQRTYVGYLLLATVRLILEDAEFNKFICIVFRSSCI